MLLDLDTILTQNVVYGLMQYLFADDEESERSIRVRQCELLVQEVATKPSLREHLPVVDSAYNFFPENVKNLVSNGPVEPLVEHLRRWHDMYPALGGMARLLASKLCDLKKFDEAKERLERSCSATVYARSGDRFRP